MATQSILLRLPDPLFQQLKRRAAQTHRTVEDEILDVVATAMPASDELPAELAEAISPLAVLDDEALWLSARSRLSTEASERLESLHLKRQREGLTEAEEQETASLVRQYERAMLVRAHAAALLKQRGHDVSSLLAAA